MALRLDGQHRLMGIQGLIDLVKTGKLERYSKDKKPIGTSLTVDTLDVQPSQLQALAEERVGIELIPAVVMGETREEAKRRVRSIFVHVNRMAVHLTPGQVKMLDEDDGFALVARRAAVSHPLLQPSHGHQRVNWKSSTIAANATVFTTLQTLAEMATRYLVHKYPLWKQNEKGLVPLRPDDDQLEEALQYFLELLDKLRTMPSIATLDSDPDTGKMRRFKKEGKGGAGHMLYRPIGQIALAQALGVLVFVKKMSLDNLFGRLKKLEKSGAFNLESPQSPFYLVLYDPSKQRMLVSGRDLAARLLQYMLGGMQNANDVKSLRNDFAESRHLGSGRYKDLDGKTIKGAATIALPPVA
jgi:DGQHR domain-containing protein